MSGYSATTPVDDRITCVADGAILPIRRELPFLRGGAARQLDGERACSPTTVNFDAAPSAD